MPGLDVVVAILFSIFCSFLSMVVVFAGTFLLALLDSNPTGQGAWAFSLFYTLPLGGVIGFIGGLSYIIRKKPL